MASRSFTELMSRMDSEREIREHFSQTLEGVRLAIGSFGGRYALADDVRVDAVTADGVPCEWVSCPDPHPGRTVVYIHGGCYISGSPHTVRECCARIARATRARVLSVDYRLAPEHPFPAALDDVVTAYRWSLGQGALSGQTVIAGESAGGGLTIASLMKIRDDGVLPMPALGVPISPWVDMTLQHETLRRNVGRDIASTVPLDIGARCYVGEGDPRGPYVSPVYGDLSGLPPLLIQVGGGEVLLDDGIAIAHKARREGVDVTLEVWPDMIHVWHWFASVLDEGAQAIDAIGVFVRRRLGA